MNIKFIHTNSVLITFSIFFTLNIISSPIVDIESVRKSEEIGQFRNIAFGYSGSRGNEDRDNYDISLSLVNNSKKYERLFVFEKSERTKDDITEDESTFLHARLLRQLNNKSYDLEAYFQSSENPFQSYKTRNLFGAGIRFSELKKIKLSVSLLHEDEESLDGIKKKTERVNLYLFKDFSFENSSFVSISSFFQPSLNNFSDDYKYSLSFSYSIPVSEKFFINFKITESFDSDPPDFAEESDQSFVTNFNYSF
tara:strand:- start:854 stop:1612 length:759 start_codon:yes stop_codon:yes gene_type:complete